MAISFRGVARRYRDVLSLDPAVDMDVNSISPNFGFQGTTNRRVSISGRDLAGVTSVQFPGIERQMGTTILSTTSTQIEMAINIGQRASVGQNSFTILGPQGWINSAYSGVYFTVERRFS